MSAPADYKKLEETLNSSHIAEKNPGPPIVYVFKRRAISLLARFPFGAE